MSFLVSIALVLFLSSVCGAQPGDVLDPLPRDYDQVRDGLPTSEGGNPGGAYCGPTSAADLLKWLNENGYPAVGDWGPSPQDVTDAIYDIGVDMNCSYYRFGRTGLCCGSVRNCSQWMCHV